MIKEPITDFSKLIEGKEYNIHSEQFNTDNKARLICFDTTPLNRPISYWQFTERGYSPVNKKQLKQMFKNNIYPRTVFSLWDKELDKNIITEID